MIDNVEAPAQAGASSAEHMLCMCPRVEFWYLENDFIVCKCGHPEMEHIMNTGSCLGKGEVSRGR